MKEDKKIILIVDDDPLINRMYQVCFEREGYKVNTAANGEEALMSVIKEMPDIMLLDVMMPKMNGVEVLKRLKKDPKTKGIPVLILTNLADKKDDVDAAKKLGAIDYFVKSNTELKDLAKYVKSVLEKN